MKNFLNISDLSSEELRLIIDEAKSRKINRKNFNKSACDIDKPFEGKSMVMIFEKPSTRTRISFDIAIKQLGGSSIILNPEGIHYGKGDESIKDTSKVLSEYSDIIMIRTSNHKNLEEKSISLVVFGVSNKKMEDAIKPYKNIENIVFTGWMDSVGIYEIMLSADLAIYPGTHSVLWEQSIGVGIPCIFKRWEGIEHVDVGGNCIFLEDSNVDEIISVLTKVIKDKELYKELKGNAMSLGTINFAYSEIAKKAIKI